MDDLQYIKDGEVQAVILGVLNLVINGWPSIQKKTQNFEIL